MLTEKDIDEQIRKDLTKFWQSPYDDHIPAGFIFRFRSSFMFHSAKSLPASTHVMRQTINAREEDLTFLQVGVIVNTMTEVPFNAMYDNPEQALDALDELLEVQTKYNELVNKNQETLNRKKNKLLEIAGHGAKTIRLNGKN